MLRALRLLIALLSSYGLVCVLLVYLCALTFFGTLYQVEHGLIAAQRRFFDSLFVSFPWPGGQLVLIVLAVNLVVGGIVRLRRSWTRVGVLITHFGVLFLLAAGWVEFMHKDDGYLKLDEGQRDDRFYSHYDYELAVTEWRGSDAAFEHVVSDAEFARRAATRRVSVDSPRLPFTVELSRWMPNSTPRAAGPHAGVTDGGVTLEELPISPNAEQNVAGVHATLLVRDGGERQQAWLWGESRRPWVVDVGDARYAIELRRQSFPLPFAIQLEDFVKEDHPGIDSPKLFRSDVLRIEGDDVQPVRIEMNEPLRHRGYTFYQSSYGPPDARPGEPLYSVFSVVKNPSDQWPKWACWVIGCGLLVHFVMKLLGYIRGERLRQAAEGRS